MSFFQRSLSDWCILRGSSTPISDPDAKQEDFSRLTLPDRSEEGNKVHSESSPEISSESDIAFSRSVLFINLYGNLNM